MPGTRNPNQGLGLSVWSRIGHERSVNTPGDSDGGAGGHDPLMATRPAADAHYVDPFDVWGGSGGNGADSLM